MSMILKSAQLLNRKCPSNYLAGIRFGGGGGGRPGGKPTFNWKEKLLLGIPQTKLNRPRVKYFPRGVHLGGDFSTIEHLLSNVPKEDVITLKNDAATEESIKSMLQRMETERETRQTQPTLNVAALYGSGKSVGSLPGKLNRKVNFSHRRVFGKNQ